MLCACKGIHVILEIFDVFLYSHFRLRYPVCLLIFGCLWRSFDVIVHSIREYESFFKSHIDVFSPVSRRSTETNCSLDDFCADR
jgi:hypothetical protein